jgi:regulator of cell morphogenesis and NO signaling
MSELINKTLAQIVTNNHRTAAVFEKHNLDFCCKGKRTLEQACAEHNIAVTDVTAELTSVLSGTSGSCQVAFPFDKLSLGQLADYIVDNHHGYTRRETELLFPYIQKVAAKHGSRHAELLKIFELFTELKEEMEMHMKKEELVLFPRIKDIEVHVTRANDGPHHDISYLQLPITMMEKDHDHAGELMSEIRKLSNHFTPPADACTTYKLSFVSLKALEADLHQHVHLENNILFPKAIALFKTIRERTLN